jgi:branched-subunit amino acid ABC-type transport system permease component
MGYLLTGIPPMALVVDPFAGAVVGGSAGLIAALLGAALVGSVLNGLRQRAAGNRPGLSVPCDTAADRVLPEAV